MKLCSGIKTIFIGLLFSSYGSAQMSVACRHIGLICDKMNPPNCAGANVSCSHPNNPDQSLAGYVSPSAKINYVKVRLISRDGRTTQDVQIPVEGNVSDLADFDVSQDTSVLMYLMRNKYLKDGDRITLAPNGIGISGDTKFAKTTSDLSKPSGSTLAQAFDLSSGEKPLEQTCHYLTAPSVIAVPCTKSTARCLGGGEGSRCLSGGHADRPRGKTICVGSAECRIGDGTVEIRNVHCHANIREWAKGDDRCPSATDCILDKTVQAIPWNPNNDLLRNNNARSVERGTRSQSRSGSGGVTR